MIPSRIMPTYLTLRSEIMIVRNSIQNGTEFLLSMTKIPPDDLGRIVQIKNTRV